MNQFNNNNNYMENPELKNYQINNNYIQILNLITIV